MPLVEHKPSTGMSQSPPNNQQGFDGQYSSNYQSLPIAEKNDKPSQPLPSSKPSEEKREKITFAFDQKAYVFSDKSSQYKFMLRATPTLHQQHLTEGIPDYPLIDWCKQFLKKGGCFIDIGANIGSYSVVLADHCSRAYCFEAERMTYHALNGSIALNDKRNIYPYCVAIGSMKNSGKRMTLHTDLTNNYQSTMSELVKENSQGPFEKERPQICSLDSFKLSEISLVKINVNGWELEVFKGAQETLKRSDYPTVIFRADPDSWYKSEKDKLFTFIRATGYEIVPIKNYPHMFIAERAQE